MISFGMMICGFTAIRIMVHITDMDGADHGDMDIMAMPDGMTRGSMEEGSMTHGFMIRIGMEDGIAVHIGQDGMTRGTARGEIRGTTITIGTTTIITTTIRSSMDRVMLTEASLFISDQEEVKAECQGDMGQALLYAAAPQQCAVLLPQDKRPLRGAALRAG